ncbi:MAG: hypothetical protein JSR80_02545 [Verrucomicrobia bacterium]|nr:hypothetical protein [Verrucomicrobiota bacterium]
MENIQQSRCISTQPCSKILCKTATVALFTTTGAVTGFKWGTAAGPGTGNVKGAIIGGGIGFIVGILMKNVWDKIDEFKCWKNENNKLVEVEDLTQEVKKIDEVYEKKFVNFVSSFEKKFGEILGNIPEAYGLRCPLSLQLPEEPTCLRTKQENPHVFERIFIEDVIKANGKDPMTGLEGYTLEDVHFDGTSIFKLYNLCENTLKDPLLIKNFHPKEIEGLKAMTNDYGKRAELFLTSELHILNQKKEKNEISNGEWIDRTLELGRMAQGINKK